ncbi:DNA replication/repair protein RecF [Algicella marina]|uniref:DNA replication and repair protein RecF n=1 Tax=Algicella marina TaxID=2683284 RepID=A0A6P1T4K8_9RHOB|nr:DNA replication/repair protein RecF [Algicella marina]QHQ36640.1 DNA replication/repair protein RecF [Algicella marina]
MAHLTHLTLSHFRSYKQATFAVGARPIALFGPNGAGKTNVLEAISLLSPGRGLRRAAPEEIARAPEAVGWKIKAELDGMGHTHEIESRMEPGQSRLTRIDGKAAPQTALGRLMRILWLVPSMDRLWLDGASERRRFLDRMTMSFEPGHADATLAYEKAMRERNRLLKDQVRDAAWFAGLEAQMAEHGAAIHANRAMTLDRIASAQAGAATAFPQADLALDEVSTAQDKATLVTALAENRPRDLAAGRTLIGPHRSELQAIFAAKATPARLCSTGEQKALLVSLILANARALAEDLGAPPILLLDEVAAHLDAGRRAALYDEICALRAQAWLTGTGAELFAELGDRADHFEVAESNVGSRVKQVG